MFLHLKSKNIAGPQGASRWLCSHQATDVWGLTRSEPPSGKSRSSEQRVRAEAHPALSGAAVWTAGSPMNPARSSREMAVLHGMAGG